MTPRSAAWYEARLAFGLSSLLPPLALPAYVLLQHLTRGLSAPYDLIRAFELILPLSVGLSASHLMSVEREENFGHLRATYAEPRWRRPVLRTLGALVLALLTLGGGALAALLTVGPFDPGEVIRPALAPSAFLLGIALVTGNLAGNYWAAAAAVMGYWFFEVLTRGAVTKAIYLFPQTWPPEGLADTPSRLLLAGLGAALIAANVGVSLRRRTG